MCSECPYCTRQLNRNGDIDKRYKWAVCGKTGAPTTTDALACDAYYSMQNIKKLKGVEEVMNKDIKIKMLQFDVNQKMLAEQLGVSQPYVSSLLNRELLAEKHDEIMAAIEACVMTKEED